MKKNKLTLNNKTNIKFKIIHSLKIHNNYITSISCFPSGKIISVSYDKSIKIYDINFNILQNIEKAHNKGITYVNVKDENNFVTCSRDKTIKTWIKIKNEFKMNQHIINSYNDCIFKIIYHSNGNLISCSRDNSVKIWEENNNKYQLNLILKDSKPVNSILLFENKNMLISSGNNGTKIWNLNNYNLIHYFKKAQCYWWNSLKKLDNNNFIVGGYPIIIISLILKQIIKEIEIRFACFGIYSFEEKGFFFIGGNSKDLLIYENNNFECVDIIKNIHNTNIFGFTKLNNNSIVSFSNDGIIKNWVLF